ncbi:NADH-quinone oxidoreductase subunit A [Chloroflexota bacterium]
MLSDFGFIGLFLVVAIAIPAIIILLSFALSYVRIRPKKPDAVKESPYECGMEPVGDSWLQFNFRYWFFAVLFVVFDVETVFLYPWAVRLGGLGLFGLIEMVVFIAILAVGLIYAWKKGALEWK